MAGNDAQVQFQQNGGTRKWRYQGVSFDGQRKEKGVVEAQTRDQAIERIKKLGLYPTDLTDTAAGTGLNTEINIKAFEKYPSKKDFAVTGAAARHHGGGWRLADPSLEHRHRTNRERETPQGSAGLRGASGRRLVLLRSHVGGSRFPVPADHGQHGSCRRDRRLPRQIAAHRGGQLRSGCEAPRADQKRHGLSGRGTGHRPDLGDGDAGSPSCRCSPACTIP